MLTLGEEVPVLPVFSWVRLHNEGAAFSFLADQSGWQRWMLVALAVAFSIYLMIEIRRLPATERLLGWAYGLVLGGALGNLWDRALNGYVVDFALAHYGDHYFPGVQRRRLGDLDRRGAVDPVDVARLRVANARRIRPDATMTSVGPNTRVTLHFSCFSRAARRSTRRGGRVRRHSRVGDGSLLPGLRAALFGLSAGADEQLRIAAARRHSANSVEENLRFMPIAPVRVERGSRTRPRGVVCGADGGELPGVVRSVEGDLVVVDFNHPLAGKTLIFDVSILKVEPISH